MYTQVNFANFLERVLAEVKAERGIEFGDYPNPAMDWPKGHWLYDIENGFSVRLFRWSVPGEVLVKGPDWDNTAEKREDFETRFGRDFRTAIDVLVMDFKSSLAAGEE